MQPQSNTATDLTKNGQRELKRTVDRIGDKARDIESNLADAGANAIVTAQTYYEEAKSRVSDVVDTSVAYAKKHPLRTAAGAVLFGYLLGFVSRRR